ncbi:hypothetical protein N7478_000290 [Penicillium angulare]|uniref:uncharacterized protein n=1 Tax=Penicillium angulare TaxID=116970 RepID=UPI002541E56D|nr:uncharacterized protein N7478_000290 [Penicillium angulare]KAJ5291039.1 hypothetical protein N7478_000290 [Penicillium angulare]
MALLSRLPSLRAPVRRPAQDHTRNDGRPPMKKQRTLEDYGVRRRRSSPDCLGTTATATTTTTTTQEMHPVGNPRPVKPPLKAAHSRTSTRRARRNSSSSIDSLASNAQLKTPSQLHINGNGSTRNIRVPDRTPSAVQNLRDESPDPLDTISPVVAATPTRPQPTTSTHAPEPENSLPNVSPMTTRTTRQNDFEPNAQVAEVVEKDETQPKPEQPSIASPNAATRSQQKRKSDILSRELLVTTPAAAPAATERRSLRSADTGARCKSELAQYFYNYEQIISLESPKPVVETLAANTIIALVDDLSEALPFTSSPDPTPFGNPLQKLYDCESITLPMPIKQPPEDPLNEEFFFKSHRRFERQEKQLRNIERDRAQHEKQQLDRLLEELRSQDWLRVMGLPSVHESEKKLYEPKREILIQELVALLNKFQVWKDEERKRKLIKEKSVPPAEAEIESRRSRKRSRPVEETEGQESSLTPGPETPSTPDSNDVDALAARQLHQEARSASDSAAKNRKSTSNSRKPKPNSADADREKTNNTDKKGSQKQPQPQSLDPSPSSPPLAPVPFFLPQPDDKPFISFFSDDKEREIALSAIPGNREERTHHVLAFGQPIPEVEEQEFQPPEDLITEEALQASQRQRRLLKRRSHGKAD